VFFDVLNITPLGNCQYGCICPKIQKHSESEINLCKCRKHRIFAAALYGSKDFRAANGDPQYEQKNKTKTMNIVRKEIQLPDGRVITLETGKLAKQADGAVMAT
jgi:hypothetical protein